MFNLHRKGDSYNLLGEEVASGKGEILEDKVKRVVGILHARDGDVSHFVDDSGEDDLPDICPKLRLKFEAALGVEEKILCEACPVLPEASIEWVVAHGGEEGAGGVEEAVEV